MSLTSTVIRAAVVSSLVVSASFIAGCSGKPAPPKLPTIGNPGVVPVTGTVTVDGQPTAGVWVQVIPTANPEKIPGEPVTRNSPPNLQIMVTSSGASGPDGKFSVFSQKPGDGVPEGDYIVAFSWDGGAETQAGAESVAINRRGRIVNEKYQASKSEVKFTAKKGTPVDLGTIDLKTK